MPNFRTPCRWPLNLRVALIPLYLATKVCCLSAFTYRWPLPQRTVRLFGYKKPECLESGHLRRTERGKLLVFSFTGMLHVTGCSLAYVTYHIHSSLHQSSKLTDSNLVRVAIDLKNQYIGCILVLALVITSLVRQPALGALMQVLVRVDRAIPAMVEVAGLPGTKAVTIDNAAWLRNVLLMLVLGVGVKAVLEVTNCLMYIRDSGSPFSSDCLLLCIVPQTLCVICALQFVAYALLIGDRLRLLNRWLVQLHPHLARGSAAAFRSTCRLVRIHRELIGAIAQLNRCFGVQNGILLLFQFVTLVELGYNSCMMLVRYAEAQLQQGDSTEDFLETVYWVVWFVVEMFALCYFSHDTVAEAHRTVHLLRLPTCYVLNQRKHFHTISQEQLAFLNRKTSISCGGLFTVDLTLLYAIVGATTTYLIILIQFDQSFNGD
uniref:Gustatory receptor n=1 Tax=Anopheles dirus TaxID=7168 RepID=A0A182NZA0_9DIPT